jgi:hypothetical protein
MSINATMGLKLPVQLWQSIQGVCDKQGGSQSSYIKQVAMKFRDNTPEMLVNAIYHALAQADAPETTETKNTSCSIDVISMQHLHDVSAKLDMPREALLRILIRYDLAKNQGETDV